jgi:hypothetical protein
LRTSQERNDRAERSLKRKQQQEIDAPKAWREYQEKQQALRDRTARLRAQRLQREAAERREP